MFAVDIQGKVILSAHAESCSTEAAPGLAAFIQGKN